MHFDPIDARMSPIRRLDLLAHVYDRRSPAAFWLNIARRLDEVERTGSVAE